MEGLRRIGVGHFSSMPNIKELDNYPMHLFLNPFKLGWGGGQICTVNTVNLGKEQFWLIAPHYIDFN